MSKKITISSNINDVSVKVTENKIKVIDDNLPNNISVTQPITNIIEVATSGPKGDKGDKGDAGDNIFFEVSNGIYSTSQSIEISGSLNVSGSNIILTGATEMFGSGELNGYTILTSNDTGSLLLTSSFNDFVSDYIVDSSSFSSSISNNTLSITNLSSSFDNFILVYNTGSFSGSFVGDGTNLTGLATVSFTGDYNDLDNLPSLDFVESVSGNLVDNTDPANPIVDFTATDYDLEDFTNTSVDPFIRQSQLPSGGNVPLFYDEFLSHRLVNEGNWFWYLVGSGGSSTSNATPGTTNRWQPITPINGQYGVKQLWGETSAIFGTGAMQDLDSIRVDSSTLRLVANVLFTNSTNQNCHIGFINDTIIAANGNSNNFTNSAYLRSRRTSGTITFAFVTSLGSNITTTSNLSLSADTWYEVVIELDNTSAKLIVNGNLIVTHTTDIPQLTSIGFGSSRTGGASGYNGLYIDNIKLFRL
jgi:hypothetical protein